MAEFRKEFRNDLAAPRRQNGGLSGRHDSPHRRVTAKAWIRTTWNIVFVSKTWSSA